MSSLIHRVAALQTTPICQRLPPAPLTQQNFKMTSTLLSSGQVATQFCQYITPAGYTMSEKHVVRELGVLLSLDLSWTTHIAEAQGKLCHGRSAYSETGQRKLCYSCTRHLSDVSWNTAALSGIPLQSVISALSRTCNESSQARLSAAKN